MIDEMKAAKPEDCLAGGGEMGALMRNSFGVASLGKQIREVLKQY